MSAQPSPLPSSAGSAAPPPRKSGCLRGCLGGCLTIVVLIIVLIIAALTVARPALEERWDRLRTEYPWIDKVVGAGMVAREMAGGSGGSGEENKASADSAGAERRKRLAGANDKGAMPRDLPLWPRPKVETFSAGDGNAAAYQRVSQSPDSVLRYFRRAMPAQGWKLDKERTGAGGVLLLYRKDQRIARVEVVADTAGTDIWLRSRAQAGKPQ